ncbi:MAG: BON domain-containing protein [Alphaproteobacteria bacterium]|nr:BON domain-containing protein [Alphaproteobacteria bacterium]
MLRMRSILLLGTALAMPLALQGCAGLLLVGGLGAAGGAGYAAAQERGVDGTVNDFTIKTNIENALISTNPEMQKGVTTNVYGGRVVLTGRLPTEQMKIAAAGIAGRTPNVRSVYNEIVVAPDPGLWDGTRDAWINTQVRSQMVLDPTVRSVNYTVDTENGTVYLIGSARSQGELDRATQIARYVPGVRKVVSYVELRSGSPVAAIPAPSQPLPDNAPPAGQPMAVPRAPIQVEKL